MLTRLKVTGFKNLIDVDVSFGPFTCVAGANGVGKSNLFDAVVFLSSLADRPLMEAARCVRDEHNRATDARGLFFSFGPGPDDHLEKMSFEAEMLIPQSGFDDLGQRADATITFLKYGLTLGLRKGEGVPIVDQLEIWEEALEYVRVTEAAEHLRFPHAKVWRDSVIHGRRSGVAFLSTEGAAANRVVKLHQDGRQGRPRSLLAANLPRTVVSSANALESPTALLARKEMQSWRLLQLEPSSLRSPDAFNAPSHIGSDGSYLAATLYRLARNELGKDPVNSHESRIYAQVANRLAELVEGVREVYVDVDRQRELFTLKMTDRERRTYDARSLSDGTLRFLALAILELDPDARGLLCFEEPENGIHPERVPFMLELLKDLCVDTHETVSSDNPLRQVVVNTHSPSVVGNVVDDDLLVAEPHEVLLNGKRCRAVQFRWLTDTWRHRMESDVQTISRGRLRFYLNPFSGRNGMEDADSAAKRRAKRESCRVHEREDLQKLLIADVK